jgi:type IV secretory pathway TraG/TraD family ATPase VirD4
MGGVREEGFLRDMSGLVGEYEYRQRQVGFQQGHSSSNVSNSRDTILSIDDLASLPRGRELLLSSGNRPVLLKTMPWMRRADADAIQASINDANGTGDEA